MAVITDNESLGALCARLQQAAVLTVDTEFMREHTYWPKLCLIQVADAHEAACIDPLAEGIDLAPFFELMTNGAILKVFHAARQDIEIFVHLTGTVPHPLFDTQIAAMVCGYGDSVGYEQLVRELAHASIDKSSRFTDWSRRPLSKKQIDYALSDVTHLRDVHAALEAQLQDTGRHDWLDEEMATLGDRATYETKPEDAWGRLKLRSGGAAFLTALRELAAWREREAQRRDVPRGRVIRDDVLLEVAQQRPGDEKALSQIRGIGGNFKGRTGQELLKAIARAEAIPPEDRLDIPKRKPPPPEVTAAAELLKVLLKQTGAAHGVAPKMIANGSDLETLAALALENGAADFSPASMNDPAPQTLKGWRYKVFGEQALKLIRGDMALGFKGGAVSQIDLSGS